MRYSPRGLGLAALSFALGCGALAESSRHDPPGGAGAPSDEFADPGAAPQRSEPARSTGGGPSSEQASLSSCPAGVVPNTLEIIDQGQLDALAGCQRIDGALLLHLFEGIDETPLLSLSDIDGSLTVIGEYPIPDPLSGFSALEEVTDVLLDGLTLRDLHPLGHLRRIGTETSSTLPLPSVPRDQGGLEIRNSSGLTSLAGLDSLESAHWIRLENDPDLVSLGGAPRLRSVRQVRSTSCPLSELTGLEPLAVEDLEISDSALVDLHGLGDARTLKRLSLYANHALVSLKGGQLPAQMDGVSVSSHRSLVDLEGLDGLTQVGVLIVEQTGIEDLSGLGALEHADELLIHSNASLTSLEGLSRLQSIASFNLAGSPALGSLRGLGTATVSDLIVSDARQLSLDGLESATISQSLSISGAAQLSASAGPPGLGRDTFLEISSCPELRDLGAFAGIQALGTLRLSGTGVETLDALSSLTELRVLDLDDNAHLQQIDGLSGVTGLSSLSLTGNSALQHLPTFGAVADACDTCGFALLLEGNLALQNGPGLPGIERGDSLQVVNNPVLTSLAGLSALRSVDVLQVERNPSLVELALPALASAGSLVVHGNAALDDTPLSPLRSLPNARIKIASNAAGPSRLAPCPWIGDGVCDEDLGDCAVGSDAADCQLLIP